MKANPNRINLRKKLLTAIFIICLGVILAYLFYNTEIVQMILDLFSPYPEGEL